MVVRSVLAAGCAALLAVAGCATRRAEAELTATYRDAGVTVTLWLRGTSLTATYRPDRVGFHLYSATMPAGGVDGLGRPTVLAAGHGLRATGPAVADRQPTTLHEAVLGLDLPVYPDGPVTLTLPVTTSAAPIQAVIGYAACSSTQCLMPVIGVAATLRPPG